MDSTVTTDRAGASRPGRAVSGRRGRLSTLQSGLGARLAVLGGISAQLSQALGSLVLQECERRARTAGATSIVLNARDDVQGFYARHGFAVVGPGETIFSVIRHVRMRKDL